MCACARVCVCVCCMCVYTEYLYQFCMYACVYISLIPNTATKQPGNEATCEKTHLGGLSLKGL